MHRLSALFLCLALMLSLGLGSVAHATDSAMCADATAASTQDHGGGDADDVPADTDKAYPDHHGNCHGHHVGVPLDATFVARAAGLAMIPPAWNNRPMVPVPADPALRPPQA
ncbi:MAG: hypothetical protein ABW173_09605 [Sphingomonas sp.]